MVMFSEDFWFPEKRPDFPRNLGNFDQLSAGPRWMDGGQTQGSWYPKNYTDEKLNPLLDDLYPRSLYPNRDFLYSPRFNSYDVKFNDLINELLNERSRDAKEMYEKSGEEAKKIIEKFLGPQRASELKTTFTPEEIERMQRQMPQGPPRPGYRAPTAEEALMLEEWAKARGYIPKATGGGESYQPYFSVPENGWRSQVVRGLNHPAVVLAGLAPDAYARGSRYNEYTDRTTPGGASYGTRVMNNLYGFGDAFNDAATLGMYDYVREGPQASPVTAELINAIVGNMNTGGRVIPPSNFMPAP
jgi:hypothetical protein